MAKRPEGEPPKLKVSQLEEKIIYIICPDKTCNLFFEDAVTCPYRCPKKEDLSYVVKCNACNNMIELSNSWTPWHRIDHPCKLPNGIEGTGCIFINGEKYYLLYEKPQKD